MCDGCAPGSNMSVIGVRVYRFSCCNTKSTVGNGEEMFAFASEKRS